MTQAITTAIRIPRLRQDARRREAPAEPIPSASLLSPRARRSLGAALTAAGATTIATSAAGVAAQPAPNSLVQLLLAVLATVTVARCAATNAGDGR
jgi:hypothetical protein